MVNELKNIKFLSYIFCVYSLASFISNSIKISKYRLSVSLSIVYYSIIVELTEVAHAKRDIALFTFSHQVNNKFC